MRNRGEFRPKRGGRNRGENDPETGGNFTPRTKGTTKPENQAKGGSPGFSAFWSAWPECRRQARPQCLAHWRSADLEARHPEIMNGLRNHKASEQWSKENGRFIPAPLKW